MSTKIITEIVESLKENFDENALQIIERTLYKALKDKEIIDVVKTQPQSNEEALVSFLRQRKSKVVQVVPLRFIKQHYRKCLLI